MIVKITDIKREMGKNIVRILFDEEGERRYRCTGFGPMRIGLRGTIDDANALLDWIWTFNSKNITYREFHYFYRIDGIQDDIIIMLIADPILAWLEQVVIPTGEIEEAYA